MKYTKKELIGRAVLDNTIYVCNMVVPENKANMNKTKAYKYWRRQRPYVKLYRLNRFNKFSAFWWNKNTHTITWIVKHKESAWFKTYHKRMKMEGCA